MEISPGIRFAGQALTRILLSCLVTFAILFSITDRLGVICISKSLLFFSSIILYLLCVFFAKPLVDDCRSWKKAKALGAKLPPRIALGLIEVLKKTKQNFETGYPGEFDDFNYWRRKELVALTLGS